MIMVNKKDPEGHAYWLYDDGQFVLALKIKLPGVSQARTTAWLKKGVYSLRHLIWHRKHECWHPALFPLLKTKSFGIQIVYVEAVDGDGKEWKGWVHPRILTRRKETNHSTGYEKQATLYPSDLKKTRELAEEFWEEIAERNFGEVRSGGVR